MTTERALFNGKIDAKIFKLCEKAQAQINSLPNAERVYDNSVEAAAKILTAIASKDAKTATGILIAEMQSGKTGAMIIVMYVAPQVFASLVKQDVSKVKVGAILITNKSLSSIHEQTAIRVAKSGFVKRAISDFTSKSIFTLEDKFFGKVVVEDVMLSGNAFNVAKDQGQLVDALENLRQAGCNCFLFLLDEAHIAVQAGQQLDNFIKHKLKLEIIQEPAVSFKPPSLFIAVTATAHQKIIWPECSYPVEIVYAHPGVGHIGRKEIAERIVDIHKIETPEQVAQLIKKYCDLKKPYKNFIFRVKSARNKSMPEEMVIREAWKLLGLNEQAISMYESTNKNIRDITDKICTPPQSGHVCILMKQALGAGVTIDTVKHIGCWWDTAFTDVEAGAQSWGRNMGYNGGRATATYPIFTNREKFNEYTERMDNAAVHGKIISPPEVRGWSSDKTENWSTPKGSTYHWVLKKFSAYKKIAEKKGYEHLARYTIEGNTRHDMAGFIAGTKPAQGQLVRPIFPGKPLEKFASSWRALKKQFPNIDAIIEYNKTANPNEQYVFFIDNLVKVKRVLKKYKPGGPLSPTNS